MKAIRVHSFGGPECLHLEEVPGLKPSAGQILVSLHAAGVNPVETYIRSGNYAFRPELPYTPGGEGAGVIAALGSDTEAFSVGDRVYLAGSLCGTYAEETLCSPAQVHPLPDGISFAQGASLGVAAITAYRALFQRAGARPGETVLIHGASGGVGTAAVQLAKGAGMQVFGSAGSKAGCDFVLKAGADLAFDHNDPAHTMAIDKATGGHGVDVIIEMLANVNLDADLRLAAKHGRIVIVGNRGKIEINPRDAMMREIDIRGMLGGNASESEREAIIQGLDVALRAGHLQPIIDREFPLKDCSAAQEAVMAPESRGKIILHTS